MGLEVGIVGLPNVGKSSLFNALAGTALAAAANYPFCTIEPNRAIVPVPDSRLEALARLVNPQKITPTTLTVVDIAGLVRGAHAGQGLGNQFLSHIREVDAILHVLRCFEAPDVVHVEGSPDPLRDKEIIDLELQLKDLETLSRTLPRIEREAKLAASSEAKKQLEVIQRAEAHLSASQNLRTLTPLTPEERAFLQTFHFLTLKPIMYVANVDEKSLPKGNAWSQAVEAVARQEGVPSLTLCVQIEAQIAGLSPEEQKEFLSLYGLEEPLLPRLIREAYRLLGLITFFTAGEKEVRAWTVRAGTLAPAAAGKIHSDMERGFIRAEVIAFEDYVAKGGEEGAKNAGKMRLEGKEYVVQDGDVVYFRFAV
ncbi:MAG: redox-regulated ATPase YchF [Bacteroidia bacterium]|nr:redox-regulated ATPase YchF [Bacteroidia bacterium]MDW8236625.1 redox-regulated ATPase YchF [Bacteroidia bacterium]